jgi:hypothetical protein
MANGIQQRIFLTCDAKWLNGGPSIQSLLSNFNLSGLKGVEIVGYPLTKFEIAVPPGVAPPVPDPPKTGVVQLLFTDQGSLNQFFHRVEALFTADPGNGPQAGADLGFTVSDYVDYWCPIGAGAAFGTRRKAIRQMMADALQSSSGVPLDGYGVNVVLVDRGIAANAVPAANKGFGWTWSGHAPFTATGDWAEHSAMLAREILAIAPAAVFYDMPLIPPRVQRVPAFLADVWAAFSYWMPAGMAFYDALYPNRRWVIVNCVGHIRPAFGREFLVRAISGQLRAPGAWCGARPGELSLRRGLRGRQLRPVLSRRPLRPRRYRAWQQHFRRQRLPGGAERRRGAARRAGAGLFLAGSGTNYWRPGKAGYRCPIAVPLETDPSRISSGTSAACGLAAGVVAALRTRPQGAGTVGTNAPPADVIKALRTSAGGTYDFQFGCGLLNARKAGQALERDSLNPNR